MEDDVVEGQGTSILDREAKLRGEPAEVPTIVTGREKPVVTENDPNDDTDDEPDEPVSAPAPTPTVPDPGVFTPGDYSFDVVVLDSEGKSPRTRHIRSVDEWDELLDGDPNLGSASALLKAQRAATKMENSLERDKRDYDTKKATFDGEKATLAQKQQSTDMMTAEIGYLQSQGKLPEVAKKYVNADWSDPEVAKQPGVKEQLALLNYMSKENKRLIAAKLPPMTSIRDAFNSYRIDQADKKAPAVRAQAAVQRKQAGAKVAGVSSSALTGGAPSGISVGRGGSLRDLGRMGY